MRWSLVPAVFLAISACRGSGNEQPRASASTTQASSPFVRACPLGVPDTRISMNEEPDRVVVSFTTTAERVPDLRARIAHQTGQHGPSRREGFGHDGRHGDAHGHGLRLWEMPPSRTIIEETPDGARLHVKPLSDGDLPRLAEALRTRVRALGEGDCPRDDGG